MITKHRKAVVAAAIVLAGVVAAGCGGGGAQEEGGGDDLVVWVDNVRTPGVKEFAKAHPDAHIRVVTIPPTPGYLLGKVSLANRSRHGWPDVVFINSPSDIAALASAPLDYAAPLDGLVDKSVRDKFAPNALRACTFGGKLSCLRNDLGQTEIGRAHV